MPPATPMSMRLASTVTIVSTIRATNTATYWRTCLSTC